MVTTADLAQNAAAVLMDDTMSPREHEGAAAVIALIASGRELERMLVELGETLAAYRRWQRVAEDALAPFAKSHLGAHEAERAFHRAHAAAVLLGIQPGDA